MKVLKLAHRVISTERPAFVMGILNATPDSFWHKSRGGKEHAVKLIQDGADIIDIGGESTRPGSDYISTEEELKRVVPLVKAVRKFSDIPISIDTRKYEVMKAAFEEGADILNDISALEDDSKLATFAAEKEIPVILMHKRGLPKTMQDLITDDDIFTQVNEYLTARAEFAVNSGIKREKIIIDPGIGFGKNTSQNFTLMRKCGELCGGKFTVLMALSRKRCIGDVTGREVEDRLAGTLSADLLSVLKGAAIVRVHDVKECVDSLNVLNAFFSETFPSTETLKAVS